MAAAANKELVSTKHKSPPPDNIVYDTNQPDYDDDPFCKFLFGRLNHEPPEQITYPTHRQTMFVDKTTNPLLNGRGPGQYAFDFNKESESHWLKTKNTDYGGVISSRTERFDGGRSALDNDTYGATLYHPIKSWANNFDKSIYKSPQRGKLHTKTNWDKQHIPKSMRTIIPTGKDKKRRGSLVRGHDVRRNSIQEYQIQQQQQYQYDNESGSGDSVNGNSVVGGGSQYWAPKRTFGEIRPHSFFASNSSRNLTFEVGHGLSFNDNTTHLTSEEMKERQRKKNFVPKTPLVAGIISANIAALNENDNADEAATKVYLHKKLLNKLISTRDSHHDDSLDQVLKKDLKVSPSEGFYDNVNNQSSGIHLLHNNHNTGHGEGGGSRNINSSMLTPPVVTFRVSTNSSDDNLNQDKVDSKRETLNKTTFDHKTSSEHPPPPHRAVHGGGSVSGVGLGDAESMVLLSAHGSMITHEGGGHSYSNQLLSTSPKRQIRMLENGSLPLNVNHYSSPSLHPDNNSTSALNNNNNHTVNGGRRTPFVLTPVALLDELKKQGRRKDEDIAAASSSSPSSSFQLIGRFVEGAGSPTSSKKKNGRECGGSMGSSRGRGREGGNDQSMRSGSGPKQKERVSQQTPPPSSALVTAQSKQDENGDNVPLPPLSSPSLSSPSSPDHRDTNIKPIHEKPAPISTNEKTKITVTDNDNDDTALFLGITEKEVMEVEAAVSSSLSILEGGSVHESSLAPGLSPRWFGSDDDNGGKGTTTKEEEEEDANDKGLIVNSSHYHLGNKQMTSREQSMSRRRKLSPTNPSSTSNQKLSPSTPTANTTTAGAAHYVVQNRNVIFPRQTSSSTIVAPLPSSPVSEPSMNNDDNDDGSEFDTSHFDSLLGFQVEENTHFNSPFQFNRTKEEKQAQYQNANQQQKTNMKTTLKKPTTATTQNQNSQSNKTIDVLVTPAGRRSFQVEFVGEGVGMGLALLSLNAVVKEKHNNKSDSENNKLSNNTKSGNKSQKNKTKNDQTSYMAEQDQFNNIQYDIDLIRKTYKANMPLSSNNSSSFLDNHQTSIENKQTSSKELSENATTNHPLQVNTTTNTTRSRGSKGMFSSSSPPLTPQIMNPYNNNSTNTTQSFLEDGQSFYQYQDCEKGSDKEVREVLDEQRGGEGKRGDDDDDENMKLIASTIEENMSKSLSNRNIETEASRSLPFCPPSTPEMTTVSLLQQSRDHMQTSAPELKTPRSSSSTCLSFTQTAPTLASTTSKHQQQQPLYSGDSSKRRSSTRLNELPKSSSLSMPIQSSSQSHPRPLNNHRLYENTQEYRERRKDDSAVGEFKAKDIDQMPFGDLANSHSNHHTISSPSSKQNIEELASNRTSSIARPNRASELRRTSISDNNALKSLRGSLSLKNKHFGGVCGPENVLI